jgi:hypothetical protein
MGPKLLDDTLPAVWLVTKLWLEITNQLFLQIRPRAERFPRCGPLKEHLVGNQFATDTGVKKAVIFGYRHRLLFNRYTSVGDTAGNIPKWQWRVRWRLKCTITYRPSTFQYKSQWSYRHQDVCYFLFWTSLPFQNSVLTWPKKHGPLKMIIQLLLLS